MNIVEMVVSIIIFAIFVVIGVLLCMGKWSFLLGAVRDLEPGTKKTLLTRISGIILLGITVFLIFEVFFR